MKKNKMMRIASVLLVAVLLSTCVIAGTFAKFTSEYTGTANATVAKWEFKLNGDAIANDFTFNLGDTVKEIGGTDEEEVDTTKKVIAPGTEGQFNIVLKNESNVTATYKITVALTGTNNPPIEFTVPADGQIEYGEEKDLAVAWKWAWIEDEENDYAGKSLEATVTIELNQVN